VAAPEVRERAVRLVQEHASEYPAQWAAIRSIAEKIGCTSEALRRWVRQAERDHREPAEPARVSDFTYVPTAEGLRLHGVRHRRH
jgi:transposase-like protein